jgi:hypothetical protein
VIKDIEGSEYDIMRGARKLLEASHPMILFECSRSHHAIEEFLASLVGYRCFAYRDGRVRPADVIADSRVGNLIAATDESALQMTR